MEPIFAMQLVCCDASSIILHLEMYLRVYDKMDGRLYQIPSNDMPTQHMRFLK